MLVNKNYPECAGCIRSYLIVIRGTTGHMITTQSRVRFFVHKYILESLFKLRPYRHDPLLLKVIICF